MRAHNLFLLYLPYFSVYRNTAPYRTVAAPKILFYGTAIRVPCSHPSRIERPYTVRLVLYKSFLTFFLSRFRQEANVISYISTTYYVIKICERTADNLLRLPVCTVLMDYY